MFQSLHQRSSDSGSSPFVHVHSSLLLPWRNAVVALCPLVTTTSGQLLMMSLILYVTRSWIVLQKLSQETYQYVHSVILTLYMKWWYLLCLLPSCSRPQEFFGLTVLHHWRTRRIVPYKTGIEQHFEAFRQCFVTKWMMVVQASRRQLLKLSRSFQTQVNFFFVAFLKPWHSMSLCCINQPRRLYIYMCKFKQQRQVQVEWTCFF